MASTYPALAVLLPADQVPPALASIDQAYELLDVGSKSGPGITTHSRHGEFGGFMRELCEGMGLRGLEFLYCKPWETPEGCCAFLFRGDDLPRLEEALDLALDWARTHPAEFGGQDAVRRALAAAPSFHPSLDDGQFIDYLLSLRAFARRAHAEGLGLLYAQWDGG